LNRAGLTAFETQIKARFNTAATATPAADGVRQDRLEYARRRWADALRTVYVQQKNVAAYIAFAEQTGLTVQDCHAIATLLVTRRRPREALAWIERGLHLGKNSPPRIISERRSGKAQARAPGSMGTTSALPTKCGTSSGGLRNAAAES
jgi:hypothetical protein